MLCVCLCVCVGCALTWLVQTCSFLFKEEGFHFFWPSDHKDPFSLGGPSDPFQSTQSHTHSCPSTHTHNHILQESSSGSYWGLWRVARSDWVLPGEGWGKTLSHAGETRRREHFTTNASGPTFKTAEMEPSQQQVSMFLGSQAGRLAFSSQACGHCWLILSVISQ